MRRASKFFFAVLLLVAVFCRIWGVTVGGSPTEPLFASTHSEIAQGTTIGGTASLDTQTIERVAKRHRRCRQEFLKNFVAIPESCSYDWGMKVESSPFPFEEASLAPFLDSLPRPPCC